MASTKSTGSTKLGRDSIAKRLGVKKNHGQSVQPGQIIMRQRGSQYLEGRGVRRGADDTLYAAFAGIVNYKKARKICFDGTTRHTTRISVVKPVAAQQ